MAAVESESDADIPDDMCIKQIPKAEYAVFTVNGNNANGEIGKAFEYIYDVWLPSSEYYFSDELCADFEYYDERGGTVSLPLLRWIYIFLSENCKIGKKQTAKITDI